MAHKCRTKVSTITSIKISFFYDVVWRQNEVKWILFMVKRTSLPADRTIIQPTSQSPDWDLHLPPLFFFSYSHSYSLTHSLECELFFLKKKKKKKKPPYCALCGLGDLWLNEAHKNINKKILCWFIETIGCCCKHGGRWEEEKRRKKNVEIEREQESFHRDEE